MIRHSGKSGIDGSSLPRLACAFGKSSYTRCGRLHPTHQYLHNTSIQKILGLDEVSVKLLGCPSTQDALAEIIVVEGDTWPAIWTPLYLVTPSTREPLMISIITPRLTLQASISTCPSTPSKRRRQNWYVPKFSFLLHPSTRKNLLLQMMRSIEMYPIFNKLGRAGKGMAQF